MLSFDYINISEDIKLKDSYKFQKSIIDNRYYSISDICGKYLREFKSYTKCLVIVSDSSHLNSSFDIVGHTNSQIFLDEKDLNISPIFCVEVSERYDGKFLVKSVMTCFSSLGDLEDLSSFIKTSYFCDRVKLRCRRDEWNNQFHRADLYLKLYGSDDLVDVCYGLVLSHEQYMSLVDMVKEINKGLSDYRLSIAKSNATSYYNVSCKRDMVIM